MSKRNHDPEWAEAKRRCGLNDEEVRMARTLGFTPQVLILNIPGPSRPGKVPVSEIVRSLYEELVESPPDDVNPRVANVVEFRNAAQPWPDNPEIPDLPPIEDPVFDDPLDEDFYEPFREDEPPEEEDIDEENSLMLRRQRLFRWAAQAIAISWSELPEVQMVAAFGGAANPLEMEVPRFRQFRRYGVEVFHECADLDMAVWLTGLDELKSLKRAMNRALALVQESPYGGVANHQVDVHVFDAAAGEYRGRLCYFGQCPKPGKRECFVPGCGDHLFLRQFSNYRFRLAQFEAEQKVILFDRAQNFLADMPRIEGRLRIVKMRPINDDDVPF